MDVSYTLHPVPYAFHPEQSDQMAHDAAYSGICPQGWRFTAVQPGLSPPVFWGLRRPCLESAAAAEEEEEEEGEEGEEGEGAEEAGTGQPEEELEEGGGAGGEEALLPAWGGLDAHSDGSQHGEDSRGSLDGMDEEEDAGDSREGAPPA